MSHWFVIYSSNNSNLVCRATKTKLQPAELGFRSSLDFFIFFNGGFFLFDMGCEFREQEKESRNNYSLVGNFMDDY